MIKYLTFLPSKKRTIATRGKNILQMGLSAGLKLRYNCANGNCGECKAILQLGTTRQIQHSDYCLTDKERGGGTLLMCCHEPDWEAESTELCLQVTEKGQDECIEEQLLKLSVSRLELASPDVMLVFCKTSRGQSLYFRAGQKVFLSTVSGEPQEVFVASCPCDGKYLEFHIHRQNNSHFSESVFAHLKKGSKLQLCGPFGNVSLRESLKPLVFIAWDSGFAAINSLIEQVHTLELDVVQSLFRFSYDGSHHYRANLCHAWEDALDDFNYIECQSDIRDADQLQQALQKMPDFLAHNVEEADFYMAIPSRFKQVLGQFLQERGVATESMFFFDS